MIYEGSNGDFEFLTTLPPAQVCIVSAGRLLELPAAVAAESVHALLQKKCQWLCVYAYSDWMKQPGGAELQTGVER